MSERAGAPTVERLRALSVTSSGLLAGLGVAVLLGWALDLPLLESFGPALLVMKANTAAGFLLTGAALWWLQEGRGARARRAGHACAAAVAAIGAVTLAQYVLGLDFGVDQLLFQEAPGAPLTSHPGRMAPNTAVGFLMVGLALLWLDRRTRGGWRPADALILAAGLIALLGIIGHLFGVDSFLGVGSYTSMAPNTAVGFLLASLSAWAARPGIGLMRQLSGDGLGAARARRLLPAVVLLPLVLGWLRLLGERLGAYDSVVGTGLFVVAMIVALAALTLRDARAVDRVAAGLKQAEEEVRRLNESLERRVLERTAELRASEARGVMLATAIEQAPVSVVVTDREGRIEYVNPAFTHITGYAAAEALGANPRILKSGVYDVSFYRELWATILSGRVWHGEMMNRHKDGSAHAWDLTIAPVRDEAGAVSRFVGVGLDVTERRRQEEALRENARVLLESQRVARLGSYRTDLVSGTWTSSAILDEIFGIADPAFRRDVPGWLSIVHPEQRAEMAAYFEEEVLAKRQAFDREYRIVRLTDGAERWVHGLGRLVTDSEGRLVEMIGTIQDTTERKRDEAERAQVAGMLRQSQKLEAIGRLGGGVAHDFNNMLGVITGYGELMRRQIGEGHPARPRLEQVLKAAERAAGLTRQLLAFSRKQVMQPRLLDLNELVRDLRKMLDRVVGEDVEIEVRAASNLGGVKADPTQIQQVLLNLVVNARDAMPKGGQLTIGTANVEFDEDYAASHPPALPGRFVMLAVSDTGAGMDAETQQRVFEPFFTTKPTGEGTGLGLATVYGIVKQSGGYIWVYSEPGRGTTFKVYLPSAEEPVGVEAVTAVTTVAPTGHETVLLVEDTESLREVIREVLEEQGYTVLLASQGKEALALVKAQQGPIDLLLTDVVMPKLGGGDLARQLAVLRPGIRVLYMSGYTEGAISRQGTLIEGARLLEKPFTSDKLTRAVRDALDRPRPS